MGDSVRFSCLKEIAAHYGVSERTVQRWHAAGMPVERLGLRRLGATSDDVDAWLATSGGGL